MKIKIYKFGGASIKDAKSIKNVAKILKKFGYKNTFVVISAIGKTTNYLEKIVDLYIKKCDINNDFNKIVTYHMSIILSLFPNNHKIKKIINNFFYLLKNFLINNNSKNYDFIYDQVVPYGELISTKIVSEYFNYIKIYNIWIDVRNYIKTDNFYREANVNWEKTSNNIKILNKSNLYVTQGFIGSDGECFTTTLGREGSDYTASIFANCLNAGEQTIWKDVPGVLNADPRYFSNTKLLSHISYKEAMELAHYGASIIHSKTLLPLQKKNIPLYVRSFINPNKPGTIVNNNIYMDKLIPYYMVKKNQILLSASKIKFSFVIKEDIIDILTFLSKNSININLIQIYATNFAICFDDKFKQLEYILNKLYNKYIVKLFKKVSLYTVKHNNKIIENKIFNNKKIILKQFNNNITQCVIKE